MKKIVRTIAFCLAALAVGGTLTSCEQAKSIIDEIINYIQGGQTYVYAGNYSLTLYDGQTGQPLMTEPTVYDANVAAKAFNGTPATVNITLPGAPIVDAIAVGDKTITDVTLGEININGLQLDGVVLNDVDATTAQGSLTVVENGQQVTYPLTGISMAKKENGKDVSTIEITEEEISIEKVSLYFGNNDEYAVMVKFPLGKAVTTNQQR